MFIDYNDNFPRLTSYPKAYVENIFQMFYKNAFGGYKTAVAKIEEYTDARICFKVDNASISQSISAKFVIQNLSSEITQSEISAYFSDNSEPQIKLGNTTYIDIDLFKVVFFTIIIRSDSINKYIKGGTKQFNSFDEVFGFTNGRIHIMNEMRNYPFLIQELVDEVLTPRGFREKIDYVMGLSYFHSKAEFGKPVSWCLVPWLDSIVTPMGDFVRFKTPDNQYISE